MTSKFIRTCSYVTADYLQIIIHTVIIKFLDNLNWHTLFVRRPSEAVRIRVPVRTVEILIHFMLLLQMKYVTTRISLTIVSLISML
jgi:hypothetical protein